MIKVVDRGNKAHSLDALRPSLIHVLLIRMRAFNANTRRLLRLLEEPDWNVLAVTVMRRIQGKYGQTGVK